MNGSVSMERFLESGARPAIDPGCHWADPIGRLGALVFQPDNSDKLWWANLRVETRIAGCASGFWPAVTCWKNAFAESRWECLLRSQGKTLESRLLDEKGVLKVLLAPLVPLRSTLTRPFSSKVFK
jgi:hypothetical protein